MKEGQSVLPWWCREFLPISLLQWLVLESQPNCRSEYYNKLYHWRGKFPYRSSSQYASCQLLLCLSFFLSVPLFLSCFCFFISCCLNFFSLTVVLLQFLFSLIVISHLLNLVHQWKWNQMQDHRNDIISEEEYFCYKKRKRNNQNTKRKRTDREVRKQIRIKKAASDVLSFPFLPRSTRPNNSNRFPSCPKCAHMFFFSPHQCLPCLSSLLALCSLSPFLFFFCYSLLVLFPVNSFVLAFVLTFTWHCKGCSWTS